MPDKPADENLDQPTILPDDEPELDADQEFEEAYIDDTDDPDVDVETNPPPSVPYGRTFYMDFNEGEFVKYGSDWAILSGKDSLRMWIEQLMYTAANAHSIFPPEYGIEDPWEILESGAVNEAEDIRKIQESVLLHDRIVAVDDFKYEYSDDGRVLTRTFRVKTDDQEDMEIVTAIIKEV